MEKLNLILLVMAACAILALTVWSLFDINRKKFNNDSFRTIWLLMIILLPVIGPLIYLRSGKRFHDKSPRFIPGRRRKAANG